MPQGATPSPYYDRVFGYFSKLFILTPESSGASNWPDETNGGRNHYPAQCTISNYVTRAVTPDPARGLANVDQKNFLSTNTSGYNF